MSGPPGPPGAPLPGPGGDPTVSPFDLSPPTDDDADPNEVIRRDVPNPDPARSALVKRWTQKVLEARKHWSPKFEQMHKNAQFVRGTQWPPDPAVQLKGERDERYVANIALRHVASKTAAIYASNPTMVAKKKERMLSTVWDGTESALMQAQQSVVQSRMAGGVDDPNALAVIGDAVQTKAYLQMIDKVCKTLELLFEQNVQEQMHPFKTMMKMSVRRGLITGVGYVKLGFQRAMGRTPDMDARIADMAERLTTIERLLADLADGQTEMTDPEAEQLRIDIASLTGSQIIVREGLSFNYPHSWAVIPDRKCVNLRTFLGCDWVAEEYLLTPEEIEEIYSVDVGSSYNTWQDPSDTSGFTLMPKVTHSTRAGGDGDEGADGKGKGCGMVWEVYSRKDGIVYALCDGYPDFLCEPGPPDAVTTRFWPWFPIVFNESYDEESPFPPSDIDLIRDPQLELNRARQGLREHRHANRPKIAVAAGVLEDEDKEKLQKHPANAVLELNALAPGQKIEDVLQAVKMPPIDPALYDTNPSMEDVERVVGSQAADMGVDDNRGTATEAGIAEGAHNTDKTSITDDLDGTLTELAQAAGEILMLNVQQSTVTQVIGPGAVWPQLTMQDVANNVYLTIEAGSTGRPNKAQEVQNMAILVPMLQRVPGISPEWLAKQMIQRLDDRLDLTDAFVEGLPSMDAMNRGAAGPGGPPGGPPGAPPGQGAPGGTGGSSPPGQGLNDPTQQGPAGQNNSPAGPTSQGRPMPQRAIPPTPQGMAGGNGANGMQPRGRAMVGMPTP